MFGTDWAIAVALAIQAASGAGAAMNQTPAEPHAATVWTDDRPLTHLFPNLLRDLRSLVSADSALVFGAGSISVVAASSVDSRVARWSARSGEPPYTIAGRVLGDGWIQTGAAVGAYALGRFAHSPQLTHVGGDLIRAQALVGVVSTVLKVSVNRSRPNGGRYAFPSGHTAATFASASTLHAHYGWKIGVPAYAAAGFVAWTRTRDGVHWLSDVAFGSVVGIVAGRTVAARHDAPRIAVVPKATQGGAALFFVIK